jgi:hypothetical protein
MHKYFNSRAVTTFYPEQRHEVLEFLASLLKDPAEFELHTKRQVIARILMIELG